MKDDATSPMKSSNINGSETSPEQVKNLLEQSVSNRFSDRKSNFIDLIEKDPFFILGLGIYEYRKFIKIFIGLWFLLTLVSLPSLYIYSHGESHRPGNENGFLWKYSIGNLGYSKVNCLQIPLEHDKIDQSTLDIEL